jgi:hypothetical protein
MFKKLKAWWNKNRNIHDFHDIENNRFVRIEIVSTGAIIETWEDGVMLCRGYFDKNRLASVIGRNWYGNEDIQNYLNKK